MKKTIFLKQMAVVAAVVVALSSLFTGIGVLAAADTLITDYEGSLVATEVWHSDANVVEMKDGVGENGSKALHIALAYHKGWDWDYGVTVKLTGDNDWQGRGEAKYLTFWYNTTHAVTAKLILCDPTWGTDYEKWVDIPAGEGYCSVDISDCTFATYRCPQFKVFGNLFSDAVKATLPEDADMDAYFDNFRYTESDETAGFITDYEGSLVATEVWHSDNNVVEMKDGVGENGSKALHIALAYHKGWDWDYGVTVKLTGDNNWRGRGDAKYLTFWHNTTHAITAKLILCDPNWGTDYEKLVDIPAGEGYCSVDISDCAFATYRTPQVKIFGNLFSDEVKATLPEDADIDAYFDNFRYTNALPKPGEVSLNVSAGEGGSVTGGGVYTVNTQVTVTATADTYYAFDGWYNGDALVSSDATYAFTITADTTLKAKFKRTVEDGTALEGNRINLFGDGVAFEARAEGDDAAYALTDVSAEKGLALNIKFNFSAVTTYAHGVRVYLKKNDNSVLLPVDDENRYLTFWADSKTPACLTFLACDPDWGKDKEYVVELKAGKHFYSIDLSDCGFEAIRCPQFSVFDYDFTDAVMDQLAENEALDICFDSFVMTAKDYSEYSVTVTASDGGTAVVDGDALVTAGENVTVKATANDGYTFVNWTVDGKAVSDDAEYTFAVTEDIVLKANFEKIPDGNDDGGDNKGDNGGNGGSNNGDNKGDNSGDGKSDITPAVTGDSVDPLLFIVLAALSLTGAVIAVFKRRTAKEN